MYIYTYIQPTNCMLSIQPFVLLCGSSCPSSSFSRFPSVLSEDLGLDRRSLSLTDPIEVLRASLWSTNFSPRASSCAARCASALVWFLICCNWASSRPAPPIAASAALFACSALSWESCALFQTSPLLEDAVRVDSATPLVLSDRRSCASHILSIFSYCYVKRSGPEDHEMFYLITI